MTTHPFRVAFRAFLLLSLGAPLACAGTADRLLEGAGRAGEREAAERIARGVSGAADAAEDAVIGDGSQAPAPRGGSAPSGGTAAPAGGGAGGSASGARAEGAADGPPSAADAPRGGAGADANLDYERGERPIFAVDYGLDNVGDFPRQLDLGNGNWEVVTWEGRRFLRGTGGRYSDFSVPLPETLPERFTVEFEVMFTHVNQQIVMAPSAIEGRSVQRYPGAMIKVRNIATGLILPAENREFVASVTGATMRIMDTPTLIRMMVDGEHVKVYANDLRVANVPNATVQRGDRLHFMDIYLSSPDNPIFFGPIRVDAGGRDLYSALEREGRVAVHGILFDTDSDGIRAESRPVLDEIAGMLVDHPDLRLSIEGHTDDQGADTYNLDLSGRRAEAVRRWLVDQHGIDAARLTSVGKGETAPVAPNDTPEGRQRNRRVELVQIR